MLAAWRQFWPTLRSEWTEFLVYALVTSVLTGLLGFGVSLALGVVVLGDVGSEFDLIPRQRADTRTGR